MSKYAALAKDIYDWCKANDLWDDNCIYFDGRAWASWKEWGDVKGNQIYDDLYEYADKNPADYFELVNPDTLSMSFEGPLNHVLNAYVPNWEELESEFIKIFSRYECFYEMGDGWNLAVYENIPMF